MPRGGKRQGTPGVSYGNRTDLAQNMGPQTGTTTAAAGGIQAPGTDLTVRSPAAPMLTPDDTPSPTDPTAYPMEPLNTPSNFGAVPPNAPDAELVRSLMLVSPNPDLRRLIARMEGRA